MKTSSSKKLTFESGQLSHEEKPECPSSQASSRSGVKSQPVLPPEDPEAAAHTSVPEQA